MRALAAAAVLLMVSACQAPPPAEMTDAERAQIEAEVNAIHAEFWDAWRETDVNGGMAYYYNSPALAFGMDGQLVSGWTTLNELAQSLNIASQAISFAESQATVLAPDVVYVREQGIASETLTTGVITPESAFAFTCVWVRQNGEWKVHFAHLSKPPPESP
jgi:ketosteroid isomerase-like protein